MQANGAEGSTLTLSPEELGQGVPVGDKNEAEQLPDTTSSVS